MKQNKIFIYGKHALTEALKGRSQAVDRVFLDDKVADGKLRAAAYWMRTELPRVAALADLCVSCEDSFSGMDPESF